MKWLSDNRVGVKVAMVGLAGLIISSLLAGFFGIYTAYTSNKPAELELVDVLVGEERGPFLGAYVKLDIKLRNTGDQVAFLKRVEIVPEHVSGLFVGRPLVVPSSEDYHIMLGRDRSVPISFAVEPKSWGRFTIILNRLRGGHIASLYTITPKILYNESQVLEGPSFNVAMRASEFDGEKVPIGSSTELRHASIFWRDPRKQPKASYETARESMQDSRVDAVSQDARSGG